MQGALLHARFRGDLADRCATTIPGRPERVRTSLKALSLALAVAGLSACSTLASSGPSLKDMEAAEQQVGATRVRIVDVDDAVARSLLARRKGSSFAETFPAGEPTEVRFSPGDGIDVDIWEAPPATLFAIAAIDPRVPATTRATTLGEQIIDVKGMMTVPFAGRIKVDGLTPDAVAREIAARLRGKANQPEIIVRRTRNASATATVVGEVNAAQRVRLTAAGERLLDALATAGGLRQPVNKTTIQITRGTQVQSMSLEQIVRDPKQNVQLQAGDIVTALFQPLSFTALGATGRNEEINFETQGIMLSQALGRVGGLIDGRASPSGAFVFRFEDPAAVGGGDVPTTPDGRTPVVYRFDLRQPASFFAMQNFAMNNRDVLFVSNAPSVETLRFLTLLNALVYPVIRVEDLTN